MDLERAVVLERTHEAKLFTMTSAVHSDLMSGDTCDLLLNGSSIAACSQVEDLLTKSSSSVATSRYTHAMLAMMRACTILNNLSESLGRATRVLSRLAALGAPGFNPLSHKYNTTMNCFRGADPI